MDLNQIYSELKSAFPSLEIYQNHPLAPYTTIKIGGPADIFIHTKSSNEFKKVLEFLNGADNVFSSVASERILRQVASEEKTIIKPNITIIGNGSNVLISDSSIRGVVIKNDSSEIEILSENKVKVASGVQLSQLINFTLDHNLLGLENFAYIPSTIGGAIAGDIHGVDKTIFSQFIETTEKYNDVSISTILNLTPGDSTNALQKVQEIIQKKSAGQPMNSLGCVFKNPSESVCLPIWHEIKPAGWIIDNELKLKGKSIGDAQISPLHANFIVNNGHCTAANYLALVHLIQSQMQEKFGFQFDLEIKLLGEF
jgi:UDP-N-acetylmuramate dehydrogenase